MSETGSDDRNVELDGRNSDDSDDPDTHDPRPRKVSTNKQVKSKGPLLKEGNLLIHEPKFSLHKWKKRYFKLRPRKLFYAPKKDSSLLYEIDLVECIIAESGNKNQSCSFKVKYDSFHMTHFEMAHF